MLRPRKSFSRRWRYFWRTRQAVPTDPANRSVCTKGQRRAEKLSRQVQTFEPLLPAQVSRIEVSTRCEAKETSLKIDSQAEARIPPSLNFFVDFTRLSETLDTKTHVVAVSQTPNSRPSRRFRFLDGVKVG